jgi:hypothetical protein
MAQQDSPALLDHLGFVAAAALGLILPWIPLLRSDDVSVTDV